jgi:hypothetical protein
MPRGSALLGAFATAMFLAAPGAASAGDEFEDGFKDELGRIAAHEVVNAGRGAVAQILFGAVPVYQTVDYPYHRPHRGRGGWEHRGRGWDGGHSRGWDRGGRWSHGHGRPFWGWAPPHRGRGWSHHRHHRRHLHPHGCH